MDNHGNGKQGQENGIAGEGWPILVHTGLDRTYCQCAIGVWAICYQTIRQVGTVRHFGVEKKEKITAAALYIFWCKMFAAVVLQQSTKREATRNRCATVLESNGKAGESAMVFILGSLSGAQIKVLSVTMTPASRDVSKDPRRGPLTA